MNVGEILMVVPALLLASCGQPSAGVQGGEQLKPAAPAAVPSPAQGTVTEGQITPHLREQDRPSPPLTVEERERLLRGTMRVVPDPSPGSDGNPH